MGLHPGRARDWFFSSIGVMCVLDDSTKETYYLSKGARCVSTLRVECRSAFRRQLLFPLNDN